jgi:hypothetical protein
MSEAEPRGDDVRCGHLSGGSRGMAPTVLPALADFVKRLLSGGRA